MFREFNVKFEDVEMLGGADNLLEGTEVTKVIVRGDNNKMSSLDSMLKDCNELDTIDGELDLNGVSDIDNLLEGTELVKNINLKNINNENISANNSFPNVDRINIGGEVYNKKAMQNVIASKDWTFDNITYSGTVGDNVVAKEVNVIDDNKVTIQDTLEQKAKGIEIIGQTYENLVEGSGETTLLDELTLESIDGNPKEFNPHIEQPVCVEVIEGYIEGIQNIEEYKDIENTHDISILTHNGIKFKNEINLPDLSTDPISSCYKNEDGWNYLKWTVGDYKVVGKSPLRWNDYGDKIYVSFKIIRLSEDEYTSGLFCHRSGGHNYQYMSKEQYNSLNVGEEHLQQVIAIEANPNGSQGGVNFGNHDRNIVCDFKVSEILSFNLTQFFGKGNEPDLDWCKKNIKYVNHNDIAYGRESNKNILLPQPLRKIGDIKDKFYWDDNKGHYCIEQKVDENLEVLDTPNIIDLPHLNKKYSLDTYMPTTHVECTNNPMQPSRILLESDTVRYKPCFLDPNKEYQVQFECKEKGNPIKLNLGGTEKTITPVVGLNTVSITTPQELTKDKLYLSGAKNKLSNIFVIADNMSTGELQDDGTYKIDIETYSQTNNIFNPNQKYVDGKFINDNGIEQINTGYGYTIDFIKSNPNTRYVGQNTSCIYCYDANKQFISRIPFWGIGTIVSSATPSNCYYVRFQLEWSKLPNKDLSFHKVAKGNSVIDIDDWKSFNLSVISNNPLAKGDKLYWNKSNKRYEIDRGGSIEVPSVTGDVIDLPRLYQRENTNFSTSTGNIKPSKVKLDYNDLD